MPKILTVVAAALIAAPTLYSAYVASAIVDRGYDWHEMDWDNDGRTQVRELIAAADIVPHRTVLDHRACIQYFAYTSAVAVRTDCEEEA